MTFKNDNYILDMAYGLESIYFPGLFTGMHTLSDRNNSTPAPDIINCPIYP